MSGLLINIAIPSLERIGKMKDRGYLINLLNSAYKQQHDLLIYIKALSDRIIAIENPEVDGV